MSQRDTLMIFKSTLDHIMGDLAVEQVSMAAWWPATTQTTRI